MAKYTINDTTLVAIADAIRAKSGNTGGIDPANMAALIAAIEAGGNERKMTTGTITPIAQVNEIEHGLGEKPEAFIWLTTFNKTMTGRAMTSGIASDEQAYDSADITSGSSYTQRLVFFLIGDFFYSLSYAHSTDWGFFTKGSLSNLSTGGSITLDENKFHNRFGVISIIPYSSDGNVTVNWFAIGGAPK